MTQRLVDGIRAVAVVIGFVVVSMVMVWGICWFVGGVIHALK